MRWADFRSSGLMSMTSTVAQSFHGPVSPLRYFNCSPASGMNIWTFDAPGHRRIVPPAPLGLAAGDEVVRADRAVRPPLLPAPGRRLGPSAAAGGVAGGHEREARRHAPDRPAPGRVDESSAADASDRFGRGASSQQRQVERGVGRDRRRVVPQRRAELLAGLGQAAGIQVRPAQRERRNGLAQSPGLVQLRDGPVADAVQRAPLAGRRRRLAAAARPAPGVPAANGCHIPEFPGDCSRTRDACPKAQTRTPPSAAAEAMSGRSPPRSAKAKRPTSRRAALERPQFLARRRVPPRQPPVRAAGGDVLAAGREGHAVKRLAVGAAACGRRRRSPASHTRTVPSPPDERSVVTLGGERRRRRRTGRGASIERASRRPGTSHTLTTLPAPPDAARAPPRRTPRWQT